MSPSPREHGDGSCKSESVYCDDSELYILAVYDVEQQGRDDKKKGRSDSVQYSGKQSLAMG